ncbi:alpha/beta fold hydrolase [Neptuniibacter halophilus]|uniref:alpha/beta fold hydrolase n=1 Tax=Neptuniibacter halophilus TaxID=651666 RepID=UPI0025735E19|nr:alpha/beta hydrolase [Neptuniibacter halophilus]
MSDYHDIIINAGDYQLAAVEYGDPEGVPVLALHGWLDNAASFSVLARHLQGVRLIALDLVGHGRSDHRPQAMPYHIWDNVADLHAVLKALQLEKVDLIGHSMGASIAMLFAASFPQQVGRLLLIEGLAPLAYEVDELPGLFAEAVVKRSRMAEKSLRPYPDFEQAVEARMNGRWPVSRSAAEALLERGLNKTERGYIWSNDPKLLLPSLLRFSPEQIRSFLNAVEAETMVIRASEGASDSIIDRWVDDLRQVEVVDMPGGHHLHLYHEAAAEIAERLAAWFK